jgi:hypothetical protein
MLNHVLSLQYGMLTISCFECDYRRGFGLNLLTTFNIRLVTTPNYSAIDDFHTLPCTKAQSGVLGLLLDVSW